MFLHRHITTMKNNKNYNWRVDWQFDTYTKKCYYLDSKLARETTLYIKMNVTVNYPLN